LLHKNHVLVGTRQVLSFYHIHASFIKQFAIEAQTSKSAISVHSFGGQKSNFLRKKDYSQYLI